MKQQVELKLLDLETIDDHPQNPRIVYREDVIDAIVANLNGQWPQQHALHVRPVGERFQIVAGHQRKRAAAKARIKKVWAWIEKMDDDAAFMELATSNNQGELSPLEVGIHALQLPNEQGGRGKKGGLSEYADKIGKHRPTVLSWRNAAKVITNVSVDRQLFLDRATHLSVIYSLSKDLWQGMCEALLANSWSVEETEKRVNDGKGYLAAYDIPKEWQTFLPKQETAIHVATGRMTAAEVKRLLDFAISVRDDLQEKLDQLRKRVKSVPVPDFVADWTKWLDGHAGKSSWNLRECRRFRDEIEDSLAEFDEVSESQFAVYCCDFRKLNLESESVDWIITDPPYPKEFVPLLDDMAKLAFKWLKPGGSLLCMIGESYLPDAFATISKHLGYHWTLAYLTPGGQSVQIFPRKVNNFWKPVLWFVKGNYEGEWIGDVVTSETNDNDKNHHHWGQSESGMLDLMNRFVKRSQTVVDPFLGGGTTGVVAVHLGCSFFGCDIDKKCVESARERITKETKNERMHDE